MGIGTMMCLSLGYYIFNNDYCIYDTTRKSSGACEWI